MGCPGLQTQRRSFSSASRHVNEHVVPISRLKILEKCPECSTIRPIPSSTRFCTRATTSSLTSPCALCPHHVSTSVTASRASVRPCSASCNVAVLTSAVGSNSRKPAAITVCMPWGYTAATLALMCSCTFSPQTTTRNVDEAMPRTGIAHLRPINQKLALPDERTCPDPLR